MGKKCKNTAIVNGHDMFYWCFSSMSRQILQPRKIRTVMIVCKSCMLYNVSGFMR